MCQGLQCGIEIHFPCTSSVYTKIVMNLMPMKCFFEMQLQCWILTWSVFEPNKHWFECNYLNMSSGHRKGVGGGVNWADWICIKACLQTGISCLFYLINSLVNWADLVYINAGIQTGISCLFYLKRYYSFL